MISVVVRSFQRLYSRLSDEDIEALLPSKSETLTIAKLKSPHRGTLYLESNIPILLDLNGKGDLIPTLPALWKFPELLPRIYLKHFTVSKYIMNGADLMLPGVSLPFEGGFLVGTLVSICISGNNLPFALGRASMSAAEALQERRHEGKLVEILQSYGDHMTKHFSNLEPPNEGFTHTVISPVEEADHPTEISVSEDVEVLEKGEKESIEEQEENVQINMDQAITECLFQALHKSIKDKDLPVAAGDLWLKHMCPNMPPGIVVDVKQSSFKKLSKFLQNFTGKDHPLLTLRIDKFSNETVVTGINRRHEDYLTFQPYSRTETAHIKAGTDESSKNKVPDLIIEEVYRMGRELNHVLSALGLEANSVLPKEQAQQVPFEYVNIAGLDQGVPDHEHIVLDKILSEALFRGQVKKNEKMPEYMLKSQLKDAAMTRMHPQFRISRGEKEILKKGALQCVQITEEKRSGNKYVTRVSGLVGFLVDVQETADELKTRCACSVTLNDAFHKGTKEKEIIVQGRKLSQISQFIENELSIPYRFIKSKQ